MAERESTNMAKVEYEIKDVTVADVKQLQAVSRQTFKETFADSNTAEDMAEFLDEAYDTNKLTKEIENPDSRFFFLMVAGQVAGYLKNEYQHKGLGLVLIKLAEKLAKEAKKDNMWLGVWEKNFNAQKFYEKDGFVRVSQHTFVVGDDPQTDYILVKKL